MKKILPIFLLTLFTFACGSSNNELKGTIWQIKTKFANNAVMTETLSLQKDGTIIMKDHTSGIPGRTLSPNIQKAKWKKDGNILVIKQKEITQKWKIIKLTSSELVIKLWESQSSEGGYLVKNGKSLVGNVDERVKKYKRVN